MKQIDIWSDLTRFGTISSDWCYDIPYNVVSMLREEIEDCIQDQIFGTIEMLDIEMEILYE